MQPAQNATYLVNDRVEGKYILGRAYEQRAAPPVKAQTSKDVYLRTPSPAQKVEYRKPYEPPTKIVDHDQVMKKVFQDEVIHEVDKLGDSYKSILKTVRESTNDMKTLTNAVGNLRADQRFLRNALRYEEPTISEKEMLQAPEEGKMVAMKDMSRWMSILMRNNGG
jgi:hypothetical protein